MRALPAKDGAREQAPALGSCIVMLLLLFGAATVAAAPSNRTLIAPPTGVEHGTVLFVGLQTDVTSGAAVNGSQRSRHTAIADLNGDGKLDLYTSNRGANRLLLGNGKGGFTEVTSGAAVNGSQESYHTAIADLNGDRKPDLYTSNKGQPNRLLLGDGKGGFTEVTSGDAVSGKEKSYHTAIADLNGDGKPDLYTSNRGQPNRLLLGDGKGGFTEVTSGDAVSGKEKSYHTAIVDLNGDGKADLYTSNDGGNGLFLGDGKGNFTRVTKGIAVSGSQESYHTAIADLNGDGKPDLYMTNNKEPNRLLLGNGKGNFTEVTSGAAVSGLERSHHTAIADLNGDGKLDLYTSIERQPNRLLLGDGKGGFAEVTMGGRQDSLHTLIADLNGDRKPDLYTSNDKQPNRMLLNEGKIGFSVVKSGAAVSGSQRSYHTA